MSEDKTQDKIDEAGRRRRKKKSTYADIEFNDSPEDQHCRVAIAVLDAVDLEVSHDGAKGGEETEQEDADKTNLLASRNVELEQHRNGKQCHNDIRHNRDDRVTGKGRARGQTSAFFRGVPRLVNLFGGKSVLEISGICQSETYRERKMAGERGRTGWQANTRASAHPR